MTVLAVANLDCEARWANAPLPPAVLRRISAAASLLAGLADDITTIWTPAPVDPARLHAARDFIPPAMITGPVPSAPAIAWSADTPAARAANDRRLAASLDFALPGALAITSVDQLAAHLAAGGASAGLDDRWVCKATLTAAGRDRCHGQGLALDLPTRTRIARLIARGGAVMFEPWLDRVADLGVCATVTADGTVTQHPPHAIRCDRRGGFVGIDLAPPALAAAELAQLAQLEAAVAAAGRAIAAVGYAGPFGVDAFVYRERDAAVTRLHPLCEINARHTFGWVARGLSRRFGATALGFGDPPPGAHVVVAPVADDPLCAWLAFS